MLTPSRPALLRLTLALVILAAGPLIGACSANDDRDDLLVFAASSLMDAFTELGEAFEASHDDVAVSLNFASSATLATQILEGAPADVYASANETQMRRLIDAAVSYNSPIFATNSLVVVTPATGSPVESLKDLAIPGIRLVLAAPEVPVGAYGRQFITAYGDSNPGFEPAVFANIASEEPNVRSVLTKVRLGEADAGIVYATDAAVAGNEIRTLDIPAEFNVVARYPITGVPVEGGNRSGEFVDFVLGDEGQAILRAHGFGPPIDAQGLN